MYFDKALHHCLLYDHEVEECEQVSFLSFWVMKCLLLKGGCCLQIINARGSCASAIFINVLHSRVHKVKPHLSSDEETLLFILSEGSSCSIPASTFCAKCQFSSWNKNLASSHW